MGTPIEAIVPAAIGVVLVNPLPILAAILMLLSPGGKSTASAYVVGWGIGMSLVLGLLLFVASSDSVVGDEREPSTLSSVVLLLLGFVLIWLSVRQWRRQSDTGKETTVPPWIEKLEKATPIAALGLGATLSGVNPKNLAFNIAAVVAIAQAHLPAGQTVLAAGFYILLASTGIAAPVAWHHVDQERATETLTRWRLWLTANYTVIMAVVLLLFGITLCSRGFGGLSR